MNEVYIKAIPHADQRYDTLGDYWVGEDGMTRFKISRELPEDYQFLVMIHELIEAYLCKKAGVSWNKIDQFDMDYEDLRNGKETAITRTIVNRITEDSEPGDEPYAPYFTQHQFASAIERLLCDKLGIPWAGYERECNRILNEVVDHGDRHV